MQYSGADLIDLQRYPIHRDSPERSAVLAGVQEDLARDGCAVLKGFLTPDGIAALTKEADSVEPADRRSSQTVL